MAPQVQFQFFVESQTLDSTAPRIDEDALAMVVGGVGVKINQTMGVREVSGTAELEVFFFSVARI